MVRSLYLVIIYFAIFGIGLSAPFLLTLGYVWVDIFHPENVAWELLTTFPVSFLMGGAAIGSYLVFDRQSPPRVSVIMIVTVVFVLWVTSTTFHAIAPLPAWWKWDWATKSMLFSVFIPFVIRSRNQIEAFVQVYVISLAANVIPFGLKTIITGGGYGTSLGLISTNSVFGEQDTLATASTLGIPLMLYLMRHTRIIPPGRLASLGYGGLVLLTIATTIGTQERAALVGLFAAAGGLWLKSRKKLVLAGIFAAIGVVIMASAPTAWWERMSTISEGSQDGSIAVRLKMWQWTMDLVAEHPDGAGFEAYRKSVLEFPQPNGQPSKFEYGRAFHSSFFEVLGEHGWIGFGLFLSLIGFSFLTLRSAARQTRNLPELAWAHELAGALGVSLLVVTTCGAFISIGFQPLFYYIFALSQCLREYVRRVLNAQAAAAPIENPAYALARP